VAYLLSTFGVFAMMGPAVFGFSITVANKRDKGWLSLKHAAPPRGFSYISARVCSTLLFSSISLAIIYAVAGFGTLARLTKLDSPLRQRMIDEMNMRKLSPKTQQTYLRAMSKLATYIKHSPEHATSERLRQFQIALVAEGASSSTINSTISGIQFLYYKTLEQPDTSKRLCSLPAPRKLGNILSIEEVRRLIGTCRSPKYRAALSVAYGAGLRIS
jgi:hypothetical protein